jgi:hypothetical protein
MRLGQVIAASLVLSVSLVGAGAQPINLGISKPAKISAGDQSAAKAAVAAAQAQARAAAAARQKISAIRAALKTKLAVTTK